MHGIATDLATLVSMRLSVNPSLKTRVFVVDDFYEYPMELRNFALQQPFSPDVRYFKGSRLVHQYDIPGVREAFKRVLGFRITRSTESHGASTHFQFCTAEDPLVYHYNSQTWAGVLYLTPDPPYSSGTYPFAHRETRSRNSDEFGDRPVFEKTGYFDRSKFNLVNIIGNVFNRLILFDAHSIRAANEYFGRTKTVDSSKSFSSIDRSDPRKSTRPNPQTAIHIIGGTVSSIGNCNQRLPGHPRPLPAASK
jgi:hypothetical protein